LVGKNGDGKINIKVRLKKTDLVKLRNKILITKKPTKYFYYLVGFPICNKNRGFIYFILY